MQPAADATRGSGATQPKDGNPPREGPSPEQLTELLLLLQDPEAAGSRAVLPRGAEQQVAGRSLLIVRLKADPMIDGQAEAGLHDNTVPLKPDYTTTRSG